MIFKFEISGDKLYVEYKCPSCHKIAIKVFDITKEKDNN